MTLLLDTSAYSAFNRGDERLRKWIHPNHEILVPLVVVGELRAGFAAGRKQEENEKLLQRFLDTPNISTITIADTTTKRFADIFRKLRQKGQPIGTNDMWIAAMALEHDAPILTLDADFTHITGLALVDI